MIRFISPRLNFLSLSSQQSITNCSYICKNTYSHSFKLTPNRHNFLNTTSFHNFISSQSEQSSEEHQKNEESLEEDDDDLFLTPALRKQLQERERKPSPMEARGVKPNFKPELDPSFSGIDLDQLLQMAEEHVQNYEEDRAEILFIHAIARGEEWFNDSYKYARCLKNYAYTLQNQNKYDEAYSFYTKSLDIYKKCEGNTDFDTGVILSNQAEIDAIREHFGMAQAKGQEAAILLKGQYGDRHDIYGAVLSNLSIYLFAQEKYEEAEPIALEALNVIEGSLGRANKFTQDCLTNYAKILKQMGKRKEVRQLRESWKSDFPEKIHLEENVFTDQEIANWEKIWRQDHTDSVNPAHGPLNHPDNTAKEMNAFLNHWEEKGYAFDSNFTKAFETWINNSKIEKEKIEKEKIEKEKIEKEITKSKTNKKE